MAAFVSKHWKGFLRSGAESFYRYAWSAIFAGLLAFAAFLVGRAKPDFLIALPWITTLLHRLRWLFLATAMAALSAAVASWFTRRRMLKSAREGGGQGLVLSDRVGPAFEYANNRVCLLIANQDAQAEYFGTFNVSGGPVGSEGTSDLFCKWMHTDSVRTKIAKGQTCRILLACMETDPMMASFHWKIEATTEKGSITIPAAYSSCAATVPVIRAPDIVLTGTIFRDPEIGGPLQFRVVLHAFGAALK